jgi:predicted phosphodiesterase
MNRYLLFLIIILLTGCDVFEFHPYDGRVSGETNVNARNIEKIGKNCREKASIRFALISDTQRWYDETADFVNEINKHGDIDFVVHAGDISDFGLTKEFIWMRDILNKMKMPYVVLLGNHDHLGSGANVYHEIFGHFNFSFLAGKTKFICLNTNALEFDYSVPVPDFAFMKAELPDDNDDYEKTVVVMHAPPFSEQFNNNVANSFEYAVRQFPKLQCCLYGHIHSMSSEDLFGDGVMYHSVSCIETRRYLIFSIKAEGGYEYETANF